ncbi:programmed cell death 1 ligand 1-like [Oreochromis niloticus]|uniref:programmed cell death 1 ligand 1-like n=1 Tax=Oreochromis niloticus TaxID=8128 RepID=UPI000904CE2F|nr:programmed cell death 1 ligand 1-like [Oreochromis niloticus]
MSAVTESLCCILLLFVCVFADQKNITAVSGQDVTLICRAPNNKSIIVVEWSRPDLDSKHVLLYRDEQFDPEEQHPSFKNRVDLQDRQMKDGDVSLIVKNVTINDTGTYECRVAVSPKRALLKTYPINSIYLSVVDPPGQTGGHTEDGSVGLKVGLPLLVVLLIAAAVVVF